MGYEFKELAGWFWLRIPKEVAINMWTLAAVIWRLDQGWWTYFQDGSFTWLLAKGLSFLPSGPLYTVSIWINHCFPLEQGGGETEREWEREPGTQVSYFICPSLRQVCTQGKVYVKAQMPGGGILGGHFEDWLPQCLSKSFGDIAMS